MQQLSNSSQVRLPNGEFSLPGKISKHYLDNQNHRESNARSYPRRIPLAIREAKGVYVKDADGNSYFDCLAGAGTLTLGHQDQPNCNYRLEWHTRSPGFFPMEYSKLGLEHFSPDYIHYFYRLPQAKRDWVRSQQDLLYKGISFNTIAQIYDLLYERSIGGVYPDVRLIPSLEVKEVEATASGYRLGYCQWQQDEYFYHDTDCIILATGYQHQIPNCVEEVQSLIQWDDQGGYRVNFDYQLALTRNIANDIFIQNGELHTHGVGAPDLGLGAHRNAVIINTLTGRSVYPTQKRNVFQQFGVKS
jgi:lysine N6-hydroxylase